MSTQNAKSQDTYSLLEPTEGCFSFGGFIKTTTHIYGITNCGSTGNQLYVSDGTEPFHILKQMAIGVRGYIPENILSVGNKLYFTISDDVFGKELWQTDGTEEGTIMIRDICEGTCGSQPDCLTEMNGIIYFNAYSQNYGIELWRTDGTTNGTYPIADLYEGGNGGLHNNRDIHAHNNTIFFGAESSNNSASVELYKTDGTEEGTVLVKDINTVPFPSTANHTLPSFPKYFFSYGNIVLFSADDGIHGIELWKTDGTAAGTVLVKDINPGLANSKPLETGSFQHNSFLYNNEVYFSANDGVHGCELWKTDGTEAGTVMVKETNTNPVTMSDPSNGDPHRMTVYNNKLYFWSYTTPLEYYGPQAWETDGTEAGTIQLTTTIPSMFSDPFTVCNDLLYMTVRYDSGDILMKYDGTTLDTVSNKTNQDKYLTRTNYPVCFNEYLYVNALSESIGTADNIGTWKVGTPSITTAAKNETIEDNTSYIVTTSQLEILTPDTILEIKIINTAGREISAPRIDNHTLDISGLPNGMYIIKTNTDTKTLTKKIILTK